MLLLQLCQFSAQVFQTARGYFSKGAREDQWTMISKKAVCKIWLNEVFVEL